MSAPDLPEAPDLPDVPTAAGVTGVGMDLVHVPGLAHQLTIPGTVFAERAFTARELRDAVRRADASSSLQAEHLAGRWAAKEAFVKAWSAAHAAAHGADAPAVIAPERLDWREIEVVTDLQGRPGLRLAGAVADAVEADLGPGRSASRRWPVSITHDGDWAAAVVLAVDLDRQRQALDRLRAAGTLVDTSATGRPQ